jgi:hypothetical protein
MGDEINMNKISILLIAILVGSIGVLSGCTEQVGVNAGKAKVNWKLDVKGYSVNPISGMEYIEKGGSEMITLTVYCNHKQDFKRNQMQTSSDCWVVCPQSFSNYVGNSYNPQYQLTITISTSSFASEETVYIEYIPV